MAGGIGQPQQTTPSSDVPGAGGFNPGPFYFGPSYTNPTGVPGQAIGTYSTPEQTQNNQLQGLISALADPERRHSLAAQLGTQAPAPTDEQLGQFTSMFEQQIPPPAQAPAPAPQLPQGGSNSGYPPAIWQT